MSNVNPRPEAASSVLTRSLVTAILESRRAYQMALALAKQVWLTGVPMEFEWNDAVQPAEEFRITASHAGRYEISLNRKTHG